MTSVARLCDVSPEGRSRLVAPGWCPDPGGPAGALRRVEVPLRPAAHRFAPGHRVRLAVALADFPRLWPSPHAGEVALEYGAAGPPRLLLPRTAAAPPGPAPELSPPAEGVRSAEELQSSQSWRVGRELVGRAASLESRGVLAYRLRGGGTVTYRHEYAAAVSAADPAGAAIECRSSVEVRRPGGDVLVRTVSRFTPRSVTVDAAVDQDGAVTFRKQWAGARGEGATPP
jgi:hypothetical protein